MKSRILKTLVIVFVICLICVLWVAFLAPYPRSLSGPSTGTPAYISVWPPPESTIWFGFYWFPSIKSPSSDREPWLLSGPPPGINVVIHTLFLPVDLLSEDRPITPFEDRVRLTVDGEQLSTAQRGGVLSCCGVAVGDTVLWDLGALYHIWWTPFLSWGDHSARITIEMASGEIVEYEWQFTIR